MWLKGNDFDWVFLLLFFKKSSNPPVKNYRIQNDGFNPLIIVIGTFLFYLILFFC
jgi:hypothetical protein